jgi:hypothetical protein
VKVDWVGLEAEMTAFNLKEFGTNDPTEIQEVIIRQTHKEARDALTGMDEEQADWDEDDDSDDGGIRASYIG